MYIEEPDNNSGCFFIPMVLSTTECHKLGPLVQLSHAVGSAGILSQGSGVFTYLGKPAFQDCDGLIKPT